MDDQYYVYLLFKVDLEFQKTVKFSIKFFILTCQNSCLIPALQYIAVSEEILAVSCVTLISLSTSLTVFLVW